ncbi:MAG: outer membrane lipoprotein LolB [Gammaproteobacteria bacterium]|nr:outer membrane lipoprotein LolB [Gammaproteobacteria bacterium]
MSLRVWARVLPGAVLLLLLGACASVTPPPPTAQSTTPPVVSPWEQRVALLTPRQHFALRGRIAVEREREGGQAQLQWAQQGEYFDLRLMAPLSQGSFLLAGDALEVSLTAPDGKVYTAPDLDTLMTRHLQWALPVAGARYWILGLPVPGRPTTQLSLDEDGRLTDLAQDGWRISVLEYQNVNGVDLPRRLFLLGNTLKLRIVVTAWTEAPH